MINLHSDSRQTLQQQDIEVYQLIEKEKNLQQNSINLIPSENYTSRAVAEALSCVFSSRYAPGPQGSKYAPQVENYDEIEKLCQERALKAFQLDPEQWGVNAQMGSGSSANLAIFLGLLEPKDRWDTFFSFGENQKMQKLQKAREIQNCQWRWIIL
ncbi:unnamed protein product [Paramecium octaurelia]|uniref:Serine hydroxymethyltransferase-like domain-containing protein n=1 Tax=Paramecium octaurelia TaxID=43137 RepID=A0A8S1W8E2_PAROT|nr:unnamed protein product [Paramecium octaurelia]